MRYKKSHFRFTKSQKRGIFFILLISVLIQLVYVFTDFSTGKSPKIEKAELVSFLREIDSLKEIVNLERKSKKWTFNPSFISDYKGYQLGLSVQEIDRLLYHREKGKYINSPKHFQEVSGISDSLLKVLTPFFKFPDWLVQKQAARQQKNRNRKDRSFKLGVRDINTATYKDFMQVNGVSESLAKRIVKYRNKLSYYSMDSQLYEVWYLKRPMADQILNYFKVLKPVTIQKINVNTAQFKELLKIVYIDYELTKKIMNYRDEIAEYQSLNELKNIPGFPMEKFDRIILYLEAN